MAEYKNDRQDWFKNYPILKSDSDNNYAHHQPGAIAIHRGNEGFKFYVIRATKVVPVTQYGRTYMSNKAFVQLIQCPERESSDNGTRKRVTERGFHELFIIDTDRFIENEIRVFTDMMDLAKLRLTQTDTIDKLVAKHGALNA